MASPYLWTEKKDELRRWSQIYIANFCLIRELLLQPARCEDILQSWNDQQTSELYASFCNVSISQIFYIHNVYFVTCDLTLKDFVGEFMNLIQGIEDQES